VPTNEKLVITRKSEKGIPGYDTANDNHIGFQATLVGFFFVIIKKKARLVRVFFRPHFSVNRFIQRQRTAR
jgi:hypothetical protein